MPGAASYLGLSCNIQHIDAAQSRREQRASRGGRQQSGQQPLPGRLQGGERKVKEGGRKWQEVERKVRELRY